MEAIVTVIFITALLAMGITYLKFCKKWAEDLVNAVEFRGKTEEEGGDNWPDIQLAVGNVDSCDDLTYADFEKSAAQIKAREKELCEQK